MFCRQCGVSTWQLAALRVSAMVIPAVVGTSCAVVALMVLV